MDDMLNSNDMIKLAPKEMPLESAEKEEKNSEDNKKAKKIILKKSMTRFIH